MRGIFVHSGIQAWSLIFFAINEIKPSLTHGTKGSKDLLISN